MYYNDKYGPAVAMNSRGEFVITWQEKFEWNRQDTVLDILAQKYNRDGYPVGSQIHITQSIPSYMYGYPEVYSDRFKAFGSPTVGINSNGEFIIIYHVPSCIDTGCTNCTKPKYQCDGYIFGQLFDSNGNLIKAVGSYSDTQAGGNSWSRSDSTPMINNPPHPDHSSTWNWPCDPEGQITYDNAYYPTVSMASDGRFMVTWMEWQCTEFDNVKARIFDSNGDPVTSEFQVNTFVGSRYDQWLPSTAINSNGNIVIVWNSRYQAGDDSGGIYGRLYDFYGNALTSEFHINTYYTQDDQWGPNVAMAPNGDFVVAWQSNGQDCGGHGIYARQFDISGNPAGSEFRVNTYNPLKIDMEEEINFNQSVTTWSERPGIAINPAGNFIIAWGSYDYDVYRDPSYGLPGWQGPGYASYGDGYGVYSTVYCKDSDGDTVSDCEDSDDDNDGMADSFETKYGLNPYDPADAGYDGDGDGLTNFQEYQQGTDPTIADSDNDTYTDDIDNCPTIYNPDQSDINEDGIGDICDSDQDNDGLTDYEEALLGTDPSNSDTDGDGVDDFYDAFPLDPSETSDSDIQIVPISTDPASQECPVIWQNNVVWLDYRNAQGDIYMYDIPNGIESRITTDSSNQFYPTISGNRVVWEDYRNGNADIYMFDISNGVSSPVITNSSNQWSPTISGNYIAWWDDRNRDYDVYMYDISNDSEIRITTDPSDQIFPIISENYIVWWDTRNGGYDIYMYDILTGGETRLPSASSDQQSLMYPGLSGNYIVWMDNRNGNWDIYMYDISTGSETQITSYLSDQSYPTISGDRIVWMDNRNGNWDIYMFDISTMTETQITTDPSDQLYPYISGNRIVWEDKRNGNPDIYIYTGDGIGDNSDNCPYVYNPDQTDSDGDGIGDACDPCVNDPSLDCGGDSDNDGMPTSFELYYHLNPNDPADAGYDDDSDGLINLDEYQVGTDPTLSDTDNDGMLDGADNCPLDLPVRIAGIIPEYFASIQSAYNAANSGDVIQVQDALLVEIISGNWGTNITLDGGYDCSYTAKVGKTSLRGMTVSGGLMSVKGFILKK